METVQTYKPQKIKRLFLKLGTCSQLFFHILNRHYGEPRLNEEKATDPLAGGILQAGHQCGMLWGSAMAAGVESHRRFQDKNIANGMAIMATRHLMNSFEKRAKYINCRSITKCDWKKPGSIFRYFITGKAVSCFRLADKWAPEAISAADEALSEKHSNIPSPCLSCTSELAKKMGATEEQTAMVSGLAGGMGLQGEACSALAVAMWFKLLRRGKEEVEIKATFNDPALSKIQESFMRVTGNKILCRDITKRRFSGLEDYSNYLQSGGCKDIIALLSEEI